MEFNFKLTNQPIGTLFLKAGISDFQSACQFIKELPYQRNSDKENQFCVLLDNGGTCSTKHALLKRLADENNHHQLKLMMGIFMMNAKNTPKLKSVLEKYQLKEIPEAHNYLKLNDIILDYTKRNSSAKDFVDDLVEEIEILPNQITDYKVEYHQNYLKNYLTENSQISYSFGDFWKIREECIFALSS